MCGIVGMVGVSAVNQRIYDALTVLQHRGQDAAGIMTARRASCTSRKDSGLVRDVFQQKHMLELKGNVGIGHVRYPTAGADNAHEAQPFYVNSPYGICLGHNGNLTNARELTEVLMREDRRHLNTDVRFRSAVERAGLRAAARGYAARDSGRHLRRRQRGLSALPRRLCGGRHGHRSRHPRFPRSERHPAAGLGKRDTKKGTE